MDVLNTLNVTYIVFIEAKSNTDSVQRRKMVSNVVKLFS